MSRKQTFDAVIESAGNGGAFVTIPFDVEALYGARRVKVRATIDGVPYRGSLVRMGGECHILGVLKEIRHQIGKDVGDEVTVTVERDDEPRVVQVPADLAAALHAEPAAAALFAKLSYTHQKEYVRWIEEAKRDETRARRVGRTIERLLAGQKGR